MVDRPRHLVEEVRMDDGEDSSDEERRDRRVDVIEMDSPGEFDEDEDADDPFYDEPPTNSTAGSTDGEDGENEDDDAMTWDTLSEASAPEAEPDDDEWYPMSERQAQFPNFALPTTTRPAISSAPQYLATSSRSYSPTGSEEFSDQEDLDFNNYVGVMRPEPTREELNRTVLDYFLHHGHSEVVHTFCEEMGIPLPEKEIREMNERNEIRNLIWEGKIEEAIGRLPAVVMEDEAVHFAVRKQHIIEMIRNEQAQEPVEYFRTHLMKDGKRPNDERMEVIEGIFTLMVFADEDSEFRVYLEQRERELTAKVVNSALLGQMGQSRSSKVDLLAKSLAWARNEVSQKHGQQKATTTVDWADDMFKKEYNMNDLVEKALRHCPLDDTTDLC